MIHGRGLGLTAGLARTTTHLASALHDSVFQKQTITSEVLPSRTKISRKKKKAEKKTINYKKYKKIEKRKTSRELLIFRNPVRLLRIQDLGFRKF